MIFVGIDWSERHHDVCVLDAGGDVLETARVPEGIEGTARLHEVLATHADAPGQVVIAIETDRGLLVRSLVAAGYEVFAINPLSVNRYRDRHRTSGAKSDTGDARVLADLVRTDRANHRTVAGDGELAEGIKLLARTHQSFVWERQRYVNRLRSDLREFYPAALEAFGTDLASSDAVAVLSIAPTPELGRRLSRSKIGAALRRAGRQRKVGARAEQIQAALRSDQLRTSASLEQTYGVVTSSLVGLIAGLNTQIAGLERDLHEAFEQHPDAEIILSLPGLGYTLGARVLGEFGDDPARYVDARARRNYGNLTDHEGLGDAPGRARPVRPQHTSLRLVPPLGVLEPHRISGSTPLLRRPTSSRQDQQPGAPRAREPACRHPARLPRTSNALPRRSRLADHASRCRLTSRAVGYLGRGTGRPRGSHPDSRLNRLSSSSAQSSAPQFEHASGSGGRALAIESIRGQA